MQNSNSFVSTRHFFNKKICLLFLLSFLVLLQFSFLNAQSSTKSVQNPAISNQIDRLLQQKMDPQDVELWIEMTVSDTADAGGVIDVTLKIWQSSVNPMDSIYIVYLAPNSSLKSSSEPLYTRYNNSLEILGPVGNLLRQAEDNAKHLDSLIFFIPELPVITDKDSTGKITTIKFKLTVNDTIEGSAPLVHWVTCYQKQNNKIINRNYVSGRTDIAQKPKLELKKMIIGNDIVAPGDTIQYSITITNSGQNKANNVYIDDKLVSDFNFKRFVLPDSATEREYIDTSRLLRWFFSTIPINSSKTVSYIVTVNPATFSNEKDTLRIENKAIIRHGLTTPDSSTETVRIPPPLFVLTKTVVGSSRVTLRDTVSFNIKLENISTTDADSVYISDILPIEFDFTEFIAPNDADSSYYIPGERKLQWFFRNFPARSTKEVNFRVIVREDVVITGESKTVNNNANASYRNIIQAEGSASVEIISPPDLVPRINSINKPEDWKLTDGIEIGIASSVLNIGGQPYNSDFKIRYWYELLDNPTVTKQWEIDVRPGPTGIPGGMKPTDPGYPIEMQTTKLLFGGIYRFCMKIIPVILPPDYSVEKDTTNNQICVLDTIKVPLRFFLSKNVYEPTKTGDQLDLIFQVPEQTDVKINIYNVAGELIKKQVDESFTTEGIYTRRWDGKNADGNLVASGVYVCALESSAGHVTRKVIIVR
ncbi:DUF11 domain-containing protein [candidate division KSB1 bacterium]|nr:DUF11 domain-containing protein [candidate division KSB1 bacterium]